MIKVPYSIVDLDKIALIFYNEIQRNFAIRRTINARPVDEATPVFLYILNNLKEIIIGHPDRLEFHIGQITPLENTAKANYLAANPILAANPRTVNREIDKWFKNAVLRIFNYDFDHNSFTKYHDGIRAYKHAMRLGINTCPYCNAQFTFTIKKHKTRPHFDHFFLKAKFPYLALSFYNLIPACYVCNSNLKNQEIFLYSTHLHPYIDSIEGLYKFKTNISSVDFLVNKEAFSINFKKNSKANPADLIRAQNNLLAFAIKDRYNYHKDYAGEIISKSYIYNNSTIKELMEDYEIEPGKKLFSSEGEIIELLLGNYIYENKLHKRILSKLTKDIAEEFGIKL